MNAPLRISPSSVLPPPHGSMMTDQNEAVSTLPPPAPPRPPASSVPPPPQRPSAPASGGEWDWDRVRDLAEQWYRPLLQREGWLALAYLFLGMLTGIGFFVIAVAAFWINFGLLFIGVGFLLVGTYFRLVEALTGVERRLASIIDVDIPARPVKPITGIGFKAIFDGERWRQLGFLLLNVFLGVALFTAGAFAWSFVLRVAFDNARFLGFSLFAFNPFAGAIAIAIAAFALGAAPRLALLLAKLKLQITSWFLGPDRLAAAERRVTTLSSQRQDILDAVASERRRIERNLHDGVQQQLVAIGLDLGMAEHHLDADRERARELIVSARQKVQGSIGELRQLGRGLHPAILEDRGIDAALSAVVANASIPISVQVDPDLELSTDVAETVYFVVNEAVANVMKHAKARVASVHVSKVGDDVRVTIHDDGQGGIDPTKGTGVAGIRARVNAVDGTFNVTSPDGGPTTLVVQIPRTRRRS
jgi:signal transduction histidine kinase